MKSPQEFIQELFVSRQSVMAGKTWTVTPPQRLVMFFIGLIILGTVLLILPWAHPAGKACSLVDACYTATSAVCVTGLIVRDTAADFTPFGQVVILALIQIGGLGYMLLATAAAVLLGRRIGITERSAIAQSLNLDSPEGMGRFVRSVVYFTLVMEAVGAVLITVSYWPQHSPGQAMALGVFHAISSFNNAGFSLFPDNFMSTGLKPLALAVVMGLTVIGGIGFLVYQEVWDHVRGQRQRYSVHTKLVAITTVLLLGLGWLGLFFGAHLNWLQALFLSVTSRTSGFNMQDIGMLPVGAHWLLILLMFVGASPGGTGGGIKTTTAATVLVALWAMMRGRDRVAVFSRELPQDTVQKALVISITMALVVVGMSMLIIACETGAQSLRKVLFEVTSALGTVGLSTGDGHILSLSATFSPVGKILIILTMFIGRLGPLTLGVASAAKTAPAQLTYPEGRVSVG
ncbi:MAG: potassium transporter TrkG [candidate division FCPU426 bacterium]